MPGLIVRLTLVLTITGPTTIILFLSKKDKVYNRYSPDQTVFSEIVPLTEVAPLTIQKNVDNKIITEKSAGALILNYVV